MAETAAWDGQAARRRERDVARVVARGKRQVAAGKLPDIPARQLLSANAMERVQALRDAGVRVVVLDECHHLLSLWGALLKAVFELLSPQHVLGLTATNPQDVTAEEAALYAQLLDTVDFSVPTPAVVREGYLAPYQELVQLCSPLDSEQAVAGRAPRALRAGAHAAGRRPPTVTCPGSTRGCCRGSRSGWPRAADGCRGRSSRAASRAWPTPGCAGCTRATSRRPTTRRAASSTEPI